MSALQKIESCVESCHECPGKEKLYEYINFINDVDEFTYAQWGHEGNSNKKIQVHESGEDAASAFSDLMCKSYNTYRQYAELNYLKKHLHEIQSAYFGHEAFTIFTAACYFHGENDHNEEKSDLSM